MSRYIRALLLACLAAARLGAVPACADEDGYSGLPQWASNTTFKGDFRFRFQHDRMEESAAVPAVPDRNRARMRLRLELETKVNDKVDVGAGLATGRYDGSADASRSTNVTLENGFSKKPIGIALAFARYYPFSWAAATGGKFKNPIWEPGDMIWDTDINPEGGACELWGRVSRNSALFLNAGIFALDESRDYDADPAMYVVQPGFESRLTNAMSLKGAFSFYSHSGLKGKILDGAAGTNSADAGDKLIYGYTVIVPALELGLKDPLRMAGLAVPRLSISGEYVRNVAASVKRDNQGYMVGCMLGAERVCGWAAWRIGYRYADYEANAFLDILPDSDRYGGETGVRAHEIMLDWGLGKNTWLGFDFYRGERLADPAAPADLVQIDWNMKF